MQNGIHITAKYCYYSLLFFVNVFILCTPYLHIGTVCQKPSASGPCFANIQRWFFNTVSGQCEIFTYGGCSGNGNNFRTKKQCEKKCQPTATKATVKKDDIVVPFQSTTFKDYKKRPFSWPSVIQRAPVLCEFKYNFLLIFQLPLSHNYKVAESQSRLAQTSFHSSFFLQELVSNISVLDKLFIKN